MTKTYVRITSCDTKPYLNFYDDPSILARSQVDAIVQPDIPQAPAEEAAIVALPVAPSTSNDELIAMRLRQQGM